MPSFIAAVLIAGCIAIYAASDPITPKEMLVSVLPAWLQGVGTIAAAYYAWQAYQSWRGQDTWRRKALFAEQVMRSAHLVSSAVNNVRFYHTFYGSKGPTLKDIDAVTGDPARADRIRQVSTTCAELRSMTSLAKHYFGRDAEASIMAVASLEGQITEAHRTLSNMALKAMDVTTPSGKELATKYCSVLGLHFYELDIDDPELRNVDDFGDFQLMAVRRLEERILPHLVSEDEK